MKASSKYTYMYEFQSLQDLPNIFRAFKTFYTSKCFQTSRGFYPILAFSKPECIFYNSTRSADFHKKLHWVLVEISTNIQLLQEREMLWYQLFPIALRSSMCWQQFTVFSSWLNDFQTTVSMGFPIDTSANTKVWIVLETHEWHSPVTDLCVITIPAISNSHLCLFM